MTATTLMPDALRIGLAVSSGASFFFHASGNAARISTSFGARFNPTLAAAAFLIFLTSICASFDCCGPLCPCALAHRISSPIVSEMARIINNTSSSAVTPEGASDNNRAEGWENERENSGRIRCVAERSHPSSCGSAAAQQRHRPPAASPSELYSSGASVSSSRCPSRCLVVVRLCFLLRYASSSTAALRCDADQ